MGLQSEKQVSGRGAVRAKTAAFFVGALMVLSTAGAGSLMAQQPVAAGRDVGAARLKLLRTASGTTASVADRRVTIEDPRTVFFVPDDKQIVFYFEWEGSPGAHRLEGTWLEPSGKTATVAAFDYEAKERRFGGQWTLPIGPDHAAGTWTFEVRVDGEPAGRLSFEIRGESRPASLPLTRRALSTAEAYRQLQAAVVVVERIDSAGEVAGAGLGFSLARDQVLTAFQVVDGATVVRLTFPDRRVVEVRELSALHRWQNWAVLPAATESLPVLTRADTAGGWQVGDRVYSIALSAQGGMTIVDATIMGTARIERSGERVILTADGGGRSAGAPVLNEYGDVIALAGDQSVPGESLLPRPMLGPSATERLAARSGAYAVPVNQVLDEAGRSSGGSFSQLAGDGTFTPALGPGRVHVARATTAQGARKEPGWINPVDEKAVFSRANGPFAVILNLRAMAKLRLVANCRILDLDGRILGEGKPTNVKANANETPSYFWQIALAQTKPALYRAEMVLDGQPVWRTFVLITD